MDFRQIEDDNDLSVAFIRATWNFVCNGISSKEQTYNVYLKIISGGIKMGHFLRSLNSHMFEMSNMWVSDEILQ